MIQSVDSLSDSNLICHCQAVDGSSPLQSGINLLPYSLGSSMASMPAAWLINYWQHKMLGLKSIVLLLNVGLLIAAVGFGTVVSLHITFNSY